MNDLNLKLKLLPVIIPVLVVSMVLHELGHGFSALALGDRTAKDTGHLTLNPAKHFSRAAIFVFVVTFVLLPFPWVWAYTPINPKNFKRERLDMALVSLAGPMVNFLLALIGIALFFGAHPLGLNFRIAHPYWDNAIQFAIGINVFMGIFNLLPIPPLDGSRIIGVLMPREVYRDWRRLDQYAPMIFMLAILVFNSQIFSVVDSGVTHTETAMQKVVGGG